MPHPGFHGVLALATRKTFSQKHWFALGLVFGSMLPDLDGYPQAFATIVQHMDPKVAAETYHRTFSHTLFFPLAILLIFLLIYLFKREQNILTLGLGISLGSALLHSVVDILGFFDGVGILWPYYSINIWSNVHLTDLQMQLLRSVNFLAFAIFIWYLMSIAGKKNTDLDYATRAKVYMYIEAALFVIFFSLALTLPFKIYNTIDGAALLLFAFPNALWVMWKMRRTIEA